MPVGALDDRLVRGPRSGKPEQVIDIPGIVQISQFPDKRKAEG